MMWPWQRQLTPDQLYRDAQAILVRWWDSIEDYSNPDDFYEINHGTLTIFLFSSKSSGRAQTEYLTRHGAQMASTVGCFWAAGGERFKPTDKAEIWVRHKRTRIGNIIPDYAGIGHEATHVTEDFFKRSGFQGIVTPDKSPKAEYYE